MRRSGRAAAACVLLGLAGCPDEDGGRPIEHPVTYFSTATTLLVEAAYEPGAEPEVGLAPDGRPVWAFLRDNLRSLFEGRPAPPQVLVPSTLGEMDRIPRTGRATWTPAGIAALAQELRDGVGSAELARFFVLFLDGHLEEDGAPAPDILGVQLRGAPVIALFGPAIRSHAGPALKASLEQTTLVHELGHALGLVNRGLPMTAPHEDPSRPGHCANPGCVMYWEIAVAPAFRRRAPIRLLSGGELLFGPECLEDARSFRPGG